MDFNAMPLNNIGYYFSFKEQNKLFFLKNNKNNKGNYLYDTYLIFNMNNNTVYKTVNKQSEEITMIELKAILRFCKSLHWL